MYKPLWVVAVALLLSACGMAERDDEGAASHDYLTFTDAAFEAYCIEEFDTNHDGRLSRYEAEGVRSIVCPNRGIVSLDNIEVFIRLEELNCANNQIERLNLEALKWLYKVNCSENRLTELSVSNLRGLTTIDCSANLLPMIDLDGLSSLAQLDIESNRLVTLDVTPCSGSLRALTRKNPLLEIIYYRSGQQIDFESPAVIEER